MAAVEGLSAHAVGHGEAAAGLEQGSCVGEQGRLIQEVGIGVVEQRTVKGRGLQL